MPVSPKTLVERFYHEVWNQADEAIAREILSSGFRFRGSLGPERHGPDGFIDYMRTIHAALGNYTCTIQDLIVSGDRAVARMEFMGLHRDTFFGVAPTGKTIRWSGAAFFTMDSSRIRELWVLGDIESVKQQLGAQPAVGIVPN